MANVVEIYTDGACSGNPGPGGFGVILKYGEITKELSCGFTKTTNNRMELRAAIAGLAALKRPCQVTLYSDSRYVIDAMAKGWVQTWQAKGWVRSKKEPVKNVDLWQELLRVAAAHQVEWVWVKGHAGNELNERADELAQGALRSWPLAEDAAA
ncbi:MAG TPA: ribonuclease HI [Spirochaetia bacterium]|nr:ribonuclease HI [Spirochaetia bacterium]